ncbi:helix-turn-helix domain-containing protein [Pelodictyon luteolum]|nr:helix-turn-helix domain-containing protein [Pelodictyon luteolum]
MMNKHNIGSSFDEFLVEEALLDETTAVALKRVIAWQIAEEMKAQNLTKSSMAKKMHTSRAALNRLLDTTDTSLTLTTLSRAASVLGRKFRIELTS